MPPPLEWHEPVAPKAYNPPRTPPRSAPAANTSRDSPWSLASGASPALPRTGSSRAELAQLLAGFSHYCTLAASRAFRRWSQLTLALAMLAARAAAGAQFLCVQSDFRCWRRISHSTVAAQMESKLRELQASRIRTARLLQRGLLGLRGACRIAAALRSATAWRLSLSSASRTNLWLSTLLHRWSTAANRVPERRQLVAKVARQMLRVACRRWLAAAVERRAHRRALREQQAIIAGSGGAKRRLRTTMAAWRGLAQTKLASIATPTSRPAIPSSPL